MPTTKSQDHARLLITYAERVRYLVQIAIPLPHCLPHTIHRLALDILRAQITLQHRVQNRFYQHLSIHRVSYVERLQTNT
jgi:hypothetical protein